MAKIIARWTPTAVRQRNVIFEYWNERNKSYSYSRKLYSIIQERIAIVKQNPEIGKNTQFADTRMVSLGHYSFFYKYTASQIIITAFWDNRQKPSKLLGLLNN